MSHLKVVVMQKKVGQEGGKCRNMLGTMVIDVLFSFNLAAILKQFCFLFCSLQPNDYSSNCLSVLVLQNVCRTFAL
jgi:hypothetical protein